MLIRDQHPEKLETPRNSIYHLILKFPSTKNKNKDTFKISIQEAKDGDYVICPSINPIHHPQNKRNQVFEKTAPSLPRGIF